MQKIILEKNIESEIGKMKLEIERLSYHNKRTNPIVQEVWGVWLPAIYITTNAIVAYFENLFQCN